MDGFCRGLLWGRLREGTWTTAKPSPGASAAPPRSSITPPPSLSEEEAGYRPCATCNSIASTIIHCGRAVDTWTSAALGEDDIWVTQGWAKKFGLPDDDRGWTYDTQPAAERTPVAELPAYFLAANRRFLDLVANVPEERLTDLVQGRRFSLPLEKLFSHIVTELNQHAGQIDYLRGMLGKDSAITGMPPPKPTG